MMVKRLLILFIVTALSLGGCILDDDSGSSTSDSVASSIEDISMGGGVILFGEQGYGLAQMGTFFNQLPFEDVTIYVNGIELLNQAGLHSNAGQLSLDMLKANETIKIAVYAFGDSVVSEIPIPETPVITSPDRDITAKVGEDLPLEISFPGSPKYFSIALSNQENLVVGGEPQGETWAGAIPGTAIKNAGDSQLIASAIEIPGDMQIPESFNPDGNYSIFFVSAVALRNIEFVAD